MKKSAHHGPWLMLAMIIAGSGHAYPQNNGVVVEGKWASQIYVSDVNGRPFKNRNEDVSGSPFFDENFKYADIILTRGRKFTGVKTRIDMSTQAVHFISTNGIEIMMDAGGAKEVSYADTTAEGILFYKFRTGYPSIDMKTANNFYQVLSEGNCTLLKSIEKKVSTRKNDISGEIFKDYETSETPYLFMKGEMKRLKKDKDFLLGELSDKQVQLAEFMQSQKLSVRNIEHIARLVNYYNSL